MNNVVYVKIFDNGKMYVGITNNYKKRMISHKSDSKNGSQFPVHCAMRKHKHTTEIIFRSNVYDDVLEMEKIVIQNFKDLGYELYNVTNGGQGTLGRTGELSPMYGRTGELHPNSKPKEFYETNAVRRDSFKRICKGQGWNFDNFEEVFSGDWYICPNGSKTKLFFYIYRGENYKHNVDIKTVQKKPMEYYSENGITRGSFKKVCKNRGWNIENFEEIDSGDWHVIPSGKKTKLFFYIYKGEDYRHKVDLKTIHIKPIEYYDENPVPRGSFKKACKNQGWNIENFEEVDSGERTVTPSDKKAKLFFYIYRGDNYKHEVDIDTVKKKPIEHYAEKGITRGEFKQLCKNRDWNFNEFTEVFTGEYYIQQSTGQRKKLYTYHLRG